jgi:hypothetical protein
LRGHHNPGIVHRNKGPDHFFGSLLSLGFGRQVSLSESTLKFVRSVSSELWNYELFKKTFKPEEGQISEGGLQARFDSLSGFDRISECDISVLAARFYEMSVSDLELLSPSVLQAILSDPAVVLRDEDSLFEAIHHRASEDLSYFCLLEFVRFEFLSDGVMQTALAFISDSFDSFTFGIWSNLQARLALSITHLRQAVVSVSQKLIRKSFHQFRHSSPFSVIPLFGFCIGGRVMVSSPTIFIGSVMDIRIP